jgi:hypothetical protein
VNQQVVPFQPAVENYGSRSLTAADVRAQVNLMQDVMAEVMKDGTHYGKIPGTNGKSLYKAGAEKLMATFKLAAKPRVEDLSQDGEIHYRVFVALETPSGVFVGEGLGECSSREDKYAWRAAVCDEEFDATPENRRRIKFAKAYQSTKIEQKKQVRTNPSDVGNTILKMAKKRAQVDAVITATAASDIFTQDIEDLAPEIVAEIIGNAEPTPEEAAAKRKAQHDEAFARHSESVAFIKDRIEANDLATVAQEWGAIPVEDQMALWLAPTKGGCLTTLERATIKEKLPKADVQEQGE